MEIKIESGSSNEIENHRSDSTSSCSSARKSKARNQRALKRASNKKKPSEEIISREGTSSWKIVHSMNFSSFESGKGEKKRKEKEDEERKRKSELVRFVGRERGVLFKRVTRAYCGIGGAADAGNFVEFQLSSSSHPLTPKRFQPFS